MSVIQNNLLMTPEGYQISRSVRLRSSATAYLSKATVGTPTNKSKWTMSMWVKRGALSSNYFSFFGKTINVSANFSLYFNTTTDQIIWNFNNTYFMTTSQVFRDPSSWYHFVFVWDSANATAALRARIYCNGSEITSWATDNRANITTSMDCWNTNDLTYPHTIGAGSGSPASLYYDGYMTEVNFIDGQALTPSSFGETDAVTGVWKPKKYAGTYGTNGFYLNFSDNSAATAAAIGKDYSGNGNNWTPNNISVTAGVTYDSMLDVPTMWADGGNGRGNYCTLNPLDQGSGTSQFIKEGNLLLETGSTGYSGTRCTMAAPSTGKWYWEVTQNVITGGMSIGIASANADRPVVTGESSTSYGYQNDGAKRTNFATASYGASYTTNDVIGVALDMDAGTLTFYKNNTSQGTAFSSLSGSFMPMLSDLSNSQSSSAYFNAGQRPFAYTPPTGFKALNTQNLPDATIKNGNQYFDATTYTGNGSTQTITNSGSMQPDLIWFKKRNGAVHHALVDAVRGTDKYLYSSLTIAEETQTTALSSFNSNGFSFAGSFGNVNTNGDTYVGWQWKESATAGFDIVTYTGNGTSGRTLAHSLGVAPAMTIVKRRDTTAYWAAWHKNLTSYAYELYLNTTDAQALDNSFTAAPSSTVLTLGSGPINNASGGTYVAYLFAEVAGFSKFGSYVGNGSTDGPFVFTNMKPRYVMIKRTDSTSNWYIFDTARDTYNVMKDELLANSSNAEANEGRWIDRLSNGFKIRGDVSNQINASGGTFVYAAFAENPFKNSLAR